MDKAPWLAPDPYVLEQPNSARNWRRCQTRPGLRANAPWLPTRPSSGPDIEAAPSRALLCLGASTV